ncbi:hypothetical protein SEA_NICOLE72_67 [Microbacterium phage Nicole72]|uniref:Uncharacterized protein n=1 Tax=Microbacterium phage Nicole72 TaxID=3062838 RepID=A0ACD4UHV6_9CAUD|nr:hypothetical protein SEA_NICOLE72_67 [Microbacterium phage Nicole72]
MTEQQEAAPAAERTEWDTDALREDFEVLAFLAPLVVVRRRADGVEGTLEFEHAPRRYFNFKAAA